MQELDVTERITDSVELDTIKTPSHVSLYYNNIRGMSSKKDHILLSTTSCDYDLIVLSETWLKEGKFSAEFFELFIVKTVPTPTSMQVKVAVF